MEFSELRDFLERELEKLFSGRGGAIEKPKLLFEKGETRFVQALPAPPSSNRILESLGVIQNHLAGVVLHSFEPGYIVFLGLGEDLYGFTGSGKTVTECTRFKFISIGATSRIEVTKKRNFTRNEAYAILELFRLFRPEKSSLSPADTLRGLGARVYEPEKNESPRDEIAGYEKTKKEIEETIVLPLLHPEVFRSVASFVRDDDRSSTPGAVLFLGPPGVGKTTMARVIAAKTGIPLVYVPIENILSKYYGESAQNLSNLFDAAALYPRVILFLDEIDSLAGSRDDGMIEATRRVLSVLLRKIDGLDSREGVLTIGATNRAEDLDRALLSRFDHILRFPAPDDEERAAIFGRYARHLEEADRMELGRLSPGLTGRTIQDICESAERRWARELIRTGKDASAPPAHLYREITEERMTESSLENYI